MVINSPYRDSDAELLKKTLEIASANASIPRWPIHLKPDAIQAEAEKVYSIWDKVITTLGNAFYVQSRDGHWESTHTHIFKSGGSMDTRISTRYVRDRFDRTPGPYKDDYRVFLDKTYREVSQLEENFKDNPYGHSPEDYNKMLEFLDSIEKNRMRLKEKSCGGLGFYYYRYLIPIIRKYLW